MQRYMALALDNIRRDPLAYLYSVVYRGLRVFIVEGDEDRQTAQQFPGSGPVYYAGKTSFQRVCSSCVLRLWAAWRRACAIALPAVDSSRMCPRRSLSC